MHIWGVDKWYSLKSYFYDFGGISIYMLVFFIALDILSSIPTVKPLTLSNILKYEIYNIISANYIAYNCSYIFYWCSKIYIFVFIHGKMKMEIRRKL